MFESRVIDIRLYEISFKPIAANKIIQMNIIRFHSFDSPKNNIPIIAPP